MKTSAASQDLKSAKMNQTKSAAVTLLCVLFAAALFAFSSDAKVGVTDGMLLCADVLIPSLFPFLVLSCFLSESGAAAWISKILRFPMKILFGSFGEFGDAVLISAIGGYPAGACSVASLAKNKRLDTQTGKILMLFCVNPSPAFAVTAVGRGMLNSAKAGWIIWISCIIASLICGVAVCRIIAPLLDMKSRGRIFYSGTEKNTKPLSDSFVDATAAACRSMLCICSMVVLFSGILELLSAMCPLEKINLAVNSIIEVTSAVKNLSAAGCPADIIAGVIAFGGICTEMQSASMLRENMSGFWFFCLSRTVHGVLSFLIARLAFSLFPTAIPIGKELFSQNVPAYSVSPLASLFLVISALVLICSVHPIFDKKEVSLNEK